MSEDFEIEIPPTFEHLAMVRSVLSSALEAEPVLKEERLQDLRLALSEATTNAIEAHNRVGTQAAVGIRITVADKKVTVRVSDQGGGFDPSKLKKHPPVTDPERLEYERGLGVTLMRRLTDECSITPTKNGTTVTLIVHR
ncbi:ATP-binding protein [bacterium]|nr:ATP-binding protein [bacterium]MDB2392815.1 ATP-binding protein [Acidimicrobiaceae bacterium]